MSEVSRRVDVEVFKDEPLDIGDFAVDRGFNAAGEGLLDVYGRYLDLFQPYWWHAQSPNGEILTNGEHYATEAGAINSIEALFGDDTTMYWARTYGEDRGIKLLRYGATDRSHQGGAE